LLVVAVSVVSGLLIADNWRTAPRDERRPAPDPAVSGTSAAEAEPTLSIPQLVASRMSQLARMWETRNWQSAAELLAEIALVDDQYPGLRAANCDTHLHWAREQFSRGRAREAYEIYQNAATYCTDEKPAQKEMSLVADYLYGKGRLEQEQWPEAAAVLQSAYDDDPANGEIRWLLHRSYLAWGKHAFAAGQLQEARLACLAALELDPESQEARDLLGKVKASGKKIEVNISRQRMFVWQGDTLLYDWVCSTGEPGRGTAAGQYSVLDKIPEAWASTWGLRMPYWLGIYWSGTLENGIHALPINRSGQTLWAGYLGTPVSFGCVILSTENARILYNWAEVGTPVWIHY
jgi:hypothetical protein